MYKLKITNNTFEREYIIEERTFETMQALVTELSRELLGGFIVSTDIIQVIDLKEYNNEK